MNETSIISNITTLIQLNQSEKEFLFSVLIPRPFKNGELIVKAGEPARHLMFVNAGYVMTYFTDKNGEDHVIQFGSEGWWSGDVYALSDDTATTPYSTKGLSDGELLLLPRPALKQLFETYPKFDRYFRIIFQKGLLRQQLRYVEGHSTSAEERYLSMLNAYPQIIRDVPQKYIASYLGITPEFLSKIRKALATADKS
jgi:CRP-like cAMP-binding protein